MKLSSSQRWAIGAITLTILIACSPPTPPVEPPIPAPKPPTLSTPEPSPATPTSAPVNPVEQPGYAGEWAIADAECGQAAKTFRLTGERIDMPPGGPSCMVKSISSQTPTGRSMIYTIATTCLAAGQSSEDTFRLNFGASDTFMKLQLNSREPVSLTRCPSP